MTTKTVISFSAVSFTALLFSTVPVQAQVPAKAWLWAHNATTAPYEASPPYSYNSSGATNSILSRASVGEYVIDLASIGAPTSFSGNYHVSAYQGNHFCNISGFGPVGTSMRAGVKCYNPAGASVDGRYTLLFHRQTANRSTFGAYAHAGGNTAIGVEIPIGPGSSWNSTGAVNSFVHQGPGRYEVNLRAMPLKGSQAIVTAINNGPVRCRIPSWTTALGGGTTVVVACNNAAGAAVDSEFFVSYITDPRLDIGPATSFGSFLWANQSTTAGYPPVNGYQVSSNGRPPYIRRSGPGVYTVNFPGLPGLDTSNAIVSAYGFSTNYCNPDHWVPAADGTDLTVRCYNGAGAAADTVFGALYTGVPRTSGPSFSIDRFNTGSNRVRLDEVGERAESSVASVPGGFRVLRQVATTLGIGSVSEVDVQNGMELTCGCNSICRTEVIYGRVGAAAVPLNLNLSRNRRFRVTADGGFSGLNVDVTVQWANNTRSSTAGVTLGAAGTADIDFAAFLGGPGGAPDWADIDGITLTFQYRNGTNPVVRSFSAE